MAAAIAEDKAFYSANGYVHIRNVFNSSEAALLSRWVEEIRAWPQSNESKWMHHYEHTAHGARLTRTENIVSYHPQLGRWLMAGKLPSLVGALLGEDVFLYKEKINYKYPGGAGYAAHQDAPAYKQISRHLTALVAVERATVANGCLEFATGRHREGLIGLTEDGILSQEAEASLDFTPCEMEPGDVAVFSSYIPHRSRPNHSGERRALLYLTYNAQREGYLRDEYYRHKRAALKSGQLSLIKHFQGVALSSPEVPDQQPITARAEVTVAGEASLVNGHPLAAPTAAPTVLDELRAMFATHGKTMYDPIVTQEEHALQAAALAERAGASDMLVTASLLHDVGHLRGDLAPRTHAQHAHAKPRAICSVGPVTHTGPICSFRWRAYAHPPAILSCAHSPRRAHGQRWIP